MPILENALQKIPRPSRDPNRVAIRKRIKATALARLKKTRKTTTEPPARLRTVKRHQTIFISDTHLGTRGCKADRLADFLRRNESDTLFLVGDIIDGWRLQRSWYWPDSHNDVVQEILRKAQEGTKVIYVPGNHDEAARDYTGLNFGGVDVVNEHIHHTADGKKFLVIHGDNFDSVVKYAKWLALLGDWAYSAALVANDLFNIVRRRFGLPYWSLSAYLKHKVKNAVEYIGNYEDAVLREAKRRNVDGVICGHIHHAEIRDIGGVTYCNDGDWVESCTALVEDNSGALEIVHWLHDDHIVGAEDETQKIAAA
jgi:UDP-2,3-diacylglucosamine pyrophosphatase LpxH